MSASFTFAELPSVSDLRLYLRRAARMSDGLVRVTATAGVLAVYAAVLYPRSILDNIPTILGLRTFSVAVEEPWDAVVPIGELLSELDHLSQMGSNRAPLNLPLQLGLPQVSSMSAATATWAGISPPRGGWCEVGELSTNYLRDSARAGMARVASILPKGGSEQLVWRVRNAVWGTTMSDAGKLSVELPTGVAFAAEGFGFLGNSDEQAHIFQLGHWLRLNLQRGYILVKTVG